MKNNSEKVYDDRGGSVRDEAKQYPIEKLKLLSTSGINGAKIYNRCTENVFRILRNHPDFKNTFRYNDWTKKKEIYKNKRWVEVSDEDYTPIQRKISSMYSPFRMLSKDMVIDAVADVCQSNIIDPAKLYIKKIIWDGVGRIDTWMQKAYGTPDDIYHRAVGSNFFKGIVNRIMRPGCKFDTCIILKGQQGCGKSTSFTMIAGNDWFLETTERADDKDFLLQFRGKLIVDFCEGETMSRTDFKALKAIISTSADTYRTPYGREMKTIPRRCVFVMTTNQSHTLKDETGNRRFYPVEVTGNVNLEWLRENRDQMFAEALHRVEILKETDYEYPELESKSIQNDNMIRSHFEDAIIDWLAKPNKLGTEYDISDGVTVDDIWCYALKCDIGRLNRRDQMEIANTLRLLEYKKIRKMINGDYRNKWIKVEGM